LTSSSNTSHFKSILVLHNNEQDLLKGYTLEKLIALLRALTASMSTAPGRLLRLTLQVYRNQNSNAEDREKFAREYLAKVAALHAKNGIEIYQQVYTPVGYRAALEDMSRRNNRGWAIDVSVLPGREHCASHP
jgi:hypothetical protein